MLINNYQRLAMETGDYTVDIITQYQVRASETAVYPRFAAVAYPALGLIGELAELTTACYQGKDAEIIAKECGDVLWYCAALANDLELDLSDVLECGHFDLFAETCTIPTVDVIGRFAEVVKKFIRDDNPVKKAESAQFIRYAVGVVNSVVFGIDYTLSDIAQLNLDKLNSRKERGVLQGDGDNR